MTRRDLRPGDTCLHQAHGRTRSSQGTRPCWRCRARPRAASRRVPASCRCRTLQNTRRSRIDLHVRTRRRRVACHRRTSHRSRRDRRSRVRTRRGTRRTTASTRCRRHDAPGRFLHPPRPSRSGRTRSLRFVRTLLLRRARRTHATSCRHRSNTANCCCTACRRRPCPDSRAPSSTASLCTNTGRRIESTRRSRFRHRVRRSPTRTRTGRSTCGRLRRALLRPLRTHAAQRPATCKPMRANLRRTNRQHRR